MAIQFTLSELSNLFAGELYADSDLVCRGATDHSSAVKAGELFFAIEGRTVDGHQFLNEAFERGAVAALVSRADALGGRPGIVVSDTKRALSQFAAYALQSRTEELGCYGITGTNGKTTTQWLMFHLLARLGRKPLRIGTLGIHTIDCAIDVDPQLNTPHPLTLHGHIAQHRASGGDSLVMEVTSHGLEQERCSDVHFEVGVFTNLTRDHLDYHGSMEDYYLAKRKLFESIAQSGASGRAAVINIDDDYGKRLFDEFVECGFDVYSYGEKSGARFRIGEFAQGVDGCSFTLYGPQGAYSVTSPLIGEFNAYNITAALLALYSQGFNVEELLEHIPDIPLVPGRMQRVSTDRPAVFVDYCHTPDSLENALTSLRPTVTGRLWVVFGCGGDRDKGKRPEMGAIAEHLADVSVVTSDNPRTEDPAQIIDDILAHGARADFCEPDRSAAIALAINQAAEDDVVLIAGKGHETYQIIGTEKRQFNDVDLAARILRGRHDQTS